MTSKTNKHEKKNEHHSKKSSHEVKKHSSEHHSKGHHAQKHHEKVEKKVSEKKHPADEKTPFYKDPLVWVVAIILIGGLFLLVQNNSGVSSSGDGTVTLTEYTDYGCPFCSKAHATVKALEEEYGDNLIIVHKNFPIPQLHPSSPKAHEAAECAKDQGKFTEYRDWLFANQQKHDITNLKQAAKDLGLDETQFNSCLDSGDKTDVVAADVAEGQALGIRGTPTFYVNDKQLVGAQPIETFRATINAELTKASGNESTSNSTSADSLEAIFVVDSRCSECDDLKYAEQVLTQQISNLEVKFIDYATEEGKELYSKYSLEYIPGILFGKGIESTEIYSQISQGLIDKGDYYYLPLMQHDPTKEICDNSVDDTGNGLIDCADSDCSESMVCREEVKGELQLFVMADCPYGKKAVEALKPIIDNFGDDLDYEIHYIATEMPDGSIRSLHGEYEAVEDETQLCVNKYSPKEFFNYTLCRSLEGIRGNDWLRCAEDTGVDVDAVQLCLSSKEGEELLKADLTIAEAISVSGSPTWLINNKYMTGGFNPELIKGEFCKHNDFDACSNTLSDDLGDVQGSCS